VAPAKVLWIPQPAMQCLRVLAAQSLQASVEGAELAWVSVRPLQCAPACPPLAHPRSEADALAADCLPLRLRLAPVAPCLGLEKQLGLEVLLKLEVRLGLEVPPKKGAPWRLAPPSGLGASLADPLLLLQRMVFFPHSLLQVDRRQGVQEVELPLASFWPAEPLQQHELPRVPADRGPAPAGLSSTFSSSWRGTPERPSLSHHAQR